MHEMSYDAELLGSMLDSGQIVAKAVANRTGYSVQSISDYRRGVTNIPIRFWRKLFRLTRDQRILELLTGELPVECVFYDQVRDIAGDRAMLQEAVKAVGDFHERQRFLIEILKDGRIDEADAESIDAYNQSFLTGLQHERELRSAILRQFNAARKECA